MNTLLPTIFLGHGNPMNALSRTVYSDGWSTLGTSIPRPRAILAISAHWYIPDSAVTVTTAPRTIHDFGGFPRELFAVQYPAPGSPELAGRVKELLSPTPVALDEGWGLDHGTWSVLTHLFPQADIPVVQLSIDRSKPASFHYEVGRRLAPLRGEGVLVMGSGNIVHNLGTYAWENEEAPPFDWAVRFDSRVRELIICGEDHRLVAYEGLGNDARLSIPTPDHYLPLLYTLGLRQEKDEVSFPVEGIAGGSLSMLAVRIG